MSIQRFEVTDTVRTVRACLADCQRDDARVVGERNLADLLDYIARLERVVDVTPDGRGNDHSWGTFRLAGSSLDARTGG